MLLKLNPEIYPPEAILNTCYAFIDRAYIFLDYDSKKENIKVSIKEKKSLSRKQSELLIKEFMNELLHYALRYQVSRNNRKIREYIIGRALYSALGAPEPDSAAEKFDYQEDPLGIAIPWEEKYGRKKKYARIKV
jgi:His-Xaa-Ser system protein HxsD